MAFDRAAAKQSASDKEDSDPEMDAALDDGRSLQVELLKENNRHREAIAELGWFSKV